jgi:hypothetical protein
MKKFMLFIHEDQDINEKLSPEEMEALIQAHMDWSDQLVSSGHLIAGDGIHPNGVCINGKHSQVEEGPMVYSETIIGGYYILKASDLEHAVEIAKSCPGHLWGGTTEIRQIMDAADYGE